MFIEEMQILVDCKRLVEVLLEEKKLVLSQLEKGTHSYNIIRYQIKRMEDALNGKGVKLHGHP